MPTAIYKFATFSRDQMLQHLAGNRQSVFLSVAHPLTVAVWDEASASSVVYYAPNDREEPGSSQIIKSARSASGTSPDRRWILLGSGITADADAILPERLAVKAPVKPLKRYEGAEYRLPRYSGERLRLSQSPACAEFRAAARRVVLGQSRLRVDCGFFLCAGDLWLDYQGASNHLGVALYTVRSWVRDFAAVPGDSRACQDDRGQLYPSASRVYFRGLAKLLDLSAPECEVAEKRLGHSRVDGSRSSSMTLADQERCDQTRARYRASASAASKSGDVVPPAPALPAWADALAKHLPDLVKGVAAAVAAEASGK